MMKQSRVNFYSILKLLYLVCFLFYKYEESKIDENMLHKIHTKLFNVVITIALTSFCSHVSELFSLWESKN